MPEPVAVWPPQLLCAADQLAERGTAFIFDVLHYRQPARAFALRFDGHVVGLPEPLRACAHRDGLEAGRVSRQ